MFLLAFSDCLEIPVPYVLVVEDDANVRQMIAVLLRSHAYEAVTASTGDEALTRVRERRPCLVLLDVDLPVMGGWLFRERQIQDPNIATISVVCMTALIHPSDVEKKLGIRCVKKPLDFPSLLGEVEKSCGPGSASPAPRQTPR